MSSEDDDTRTDEYWMGVRDALRMVDSFHKWSKRNPSRAKDLEDFIHDGLIAAAKRCESCLRDKMGLSFIEEEDEEDEIILEEFPEHEEEEEEEEDEIILEESPEHEEEDDDDVKPESSIEEPPSHVEPETFTPPPDDSDESSISMDRVERIEDESIDELSIEGPPREFSTDFDLVEPTPMFVDEEPESIVPTEPEEVLSESTLEESETDQEPDSEEQPDKPSFTWSEYEDTVTPSSEPEPQDSEVDISASEYEEISTSVDEEKLPEEPPEPPKVWSPYDEPSIPEDSSTEEETEIEVDETESLDEGDGEPVITEPPLPPPPESEEDEEERKRRARRLFFGA